jgi:hypothetical protein
MYSLTWDQDEIRFFEPDEEFVKFTIDNDVEAHISCFSCGLRNRRHEAKIPRPLPGKRGFKYRDINYHVFDFVYIVPEEFVGVYLLAQIESVSVMKKKITVRYYGRYNDIRRSRHQHKSGKTTIPISTHDVRIVFSFYGCLLLILHDLSFAYTVPNAPEKLTSQRQMANSTSGGSHITVLQSTSLNGWIMTITSSSSIRTPVQDMPKTLTTYVPFQKVSGRTVKNVFPLEKRLLKRKNCT